MMRHAFLRFALNVVTFPLLISVGYGADRYGTATYGRPPKRTDNKYGTARYGTGKYGGS